MSATSAQFIIELTNICNFRCTYCYLEHSSTISQNSGHKMNKHVAERTMEYIYKNFSNIMSHVYIDFLDGEPLLNFPMLKIMVERGKLLADPGFFVFRFTTNGSLLDKNIIEYAMLNNIYFNISVDGTPHTHDTNRVLDNGSGTSSVVFDKFDLIEDKSRIGIISTYAPNTINDIVSGTEFLIEKGFKNIELCVCMGISDRYDPQELLSSFSNAVDIFINRYDKNIYDCRNVALDNILETLFSKYINGSSGESRGCIKPYKVNFEGDVYSCDRIPKEFNHRIASVFDKQPIDHINFHSKHSCNNLVFDSCSTCQNSSCCAPCYVYVNDFYSNLLKNGEYAYCAMKKILLHKALELFNRKKGDILFNIAFSRDIKNKLLDGDYEIT